jgi:type 1 fimbria pilin
MLSRESISYDVGIQNEGNNKGLIVLMGGGMEEPLAGNGVGNQTLQTPTTRTHLQGFGPMIATTSSSAYSTPLAAGSVNGDRSRTLSPVEFAALPASLKQYAPPSLHRIILSK